MPRNALDRKSEARNGSLCVQIAVRPSFGGLSQQEIERKIRHRRAAEESGHGQGLGEKMRQQGKETGAGGGRMRAFSAMRSGTWARSLIKASWTTVVWTAQGCREAGGEGGGRVGGICTLPSEDRRRRTAGWPDGALVNLANNPTSASSPSSGVTASRSHRGWALPVNSRGSGRETRSEASIPEGGGGVSLPLATAATHTTSCQARIRDAGARSINS